MRPCVSELEIHEDKATDHESEMLGAQLSPLLNSLFDKHFSLASYVSDPTVGSCARSPRRAMTRKHCINIPPGDRLLFEPPSCSETVMLTSLVIATLSFLPIFTVTLKRRSLLEASPPFLLQECPCFKQQFG